MPSTITIQPPPAAPVELTASQLTAKQILADSDLALNRLAATVQRSFELLWGTKESPKPKEEAQAALIALGADAAPLFARHAAIVAFLTSEGLATFAPWETVTAYAVGADGVLGDLAPEWITEEGVA
tara:strand:+ start:435 stop:815 length:381 start_codon:yes stop_codon:yes gene_type:complete